MAQQIFDITNIIREQKEVPRLKWDAEAAIAAKHHSEDMNENQYFSHYRLNGDGLKKRLMDVEATYLSAGENIAAHYIDSPATIHGWMNSEGHRETLLNEAYNYLGVGVYELYYTQNFIEK
ncbi:CAP domain-containing protein [Gracilibacillus halophilus]|uniref:CAP domain-containing protein n=1 Tax=Gracilibacillus halophilus TaxID=470864 RepID=UPI0003A32D82|nr:CAP domain-containing protein [Gracilibacillus halophilus]